MLTVHKEDPTAHLPGELLPSQAEEDPARCAPTTAIGQEDAALGFDLKRLLQEVVGELDPHRFDEAFDVLDSAARLYKTIRARFEA